MQAQTAPSRSRQQWLWYQRADFLGGLTAVLALVAWLAFPPARTPLGALGWLAMIAYCLVAAIPMVVLTMDKRRHPFFGTSAALFFIFVSCLVFYRYSGAKWELLGEMFFQKDILLETWPILLGGLGNTLFLFFCAAFLSLTIAPVIAIIRTLGNPIFNLVIDSFVDVFRSLPILVLVIFIYYALPFLEIHTSPFAAGVIGLFLSALAFMIEYFRAGIESVNRGQVEAARSLGLNLVQTMWLVVLPQAMRVVVPPTTGHLVGLVKSTAYVSVVGMPELLKRAMEIVEWKSNPTPLVTITIVYLILLLPLMYSSTKLERRLAKWTTRHQ